MSELRDGCGGPGAVAKRIHHEGAIRPFPSGKSHYQSSEQLHRSERLDSCLRRNDAGTIGQGKWDIQKLPRRRG